MTFSDRLVLVTAAALLTLSTPLAAKKQGLPEVTEDGLHRVHASGMALMSAEPGADLQGYVKVPLLEALNEARQGAAGVDPESEADS